MSARGFIVLLLATVLAVIVATVAAVQPKMSSVEAVAGGEMFPALAQHTGDVHRVDLVTPQYTASWEQREGAWVASERGGYPARKGMVPDLILSLAKLTKVAAKTAQADWYQYIRVGDPAATPPTGVARVTVTSADGRTLADAILGSRSFSIPASHMRGGMFVRESGETQSWLVEGTASVPTELPGWFDTIVDVPGTDITSVAVLADGKVSFEARKTDRTNGIYEIVQLDPAAGSGVANSNGIRNLTSAIVGVRVDDVRAADSFTLGEARTVRFTTNSGLQLDAEIFNTDEKAWATFKASAPAGSDASAAAADINTRTGSWAFLLNESRASRLNQPIANLVQEPGRPAMDGIAPLPLGENGIPMFEPPVPGAAPVLPAF